LLTLNADWGFFLEIFSFPCVFDIFSSFSKFFPSSLREEEGCCWVVFLELGVSPGWISFLRGGRRFLFVCGFLDSSTIFNISFLKEENSFWIAGVTLSGLFNNKEV